MIIPCIKLHTFLFCVFFCLCISCVSHVFAEDTLCLQNEAAFEGKLLKVKKNSILFYTLNQGYEIPMQDIQFILPDSTLQAKRIFTPCEYARYDAKHYHKRGAEHVFYGAAFGIFSVIITSFSKATPERGRYTLKKSVNKELFNNPEYLKCYRKKAKTQLIANELMGSAIWGFIFLAIL